VFSKALFSNFVYDILMVFGDPEIKPFQEDYYALTREWPTGFICPITLKDTPREQVCAGHILNQGIRQASRRTVAQRRDVDNYFGTAIEPDLIKYLNFPMLTPAEHLAKTRTLTITFPSGEREEAFFAGPEAGNRFMKVDIFDSDGKAIASPYLRSKTAQAGQYRDLQIEWALVVHDLAMVGALMKSAYLALFSLVGYRYALDPLGNIVRRQLSAFFDDRANRESAADYFGQFQGAVIVSLDGVLDTIPDTLEGGTMLFHYAKGGRKSGILFGVSCLFRVNTTTLIVTLPAYAKYGFSLITLNHYRALLKNRDMQHAIHLVRFNNDRFELSPKPLDIRYISNANPAS
jgi:hypothetical protein